MGGRDFGNEIRGILKVFFPRFGKVVTSLRMFEYKKIHRSRKFSNSNLCSFTD